MAYKCEHGEGLTFCVDCADKAEVRITELEKDAQMWSKQYGKAAARVTKLEQYKQDAEQRFVEVVRQRDKAEAHTEDLEQRLETAETCMEKSQERVKELESEIKKAEVREETYSAGFRMACDKIDKLESFSAAARDALEQVLTDNGVSVHGLKHTIIENVRSLLSDAPPLPDLAAARDLADEIVWTSEPLMLDLKKAQALARRFLDSTKEKP